MADQGTSQGGGAHGAFAYFIASGMPGLLIALVELQGIAIDHGLVEFRKALSDIIDGLLKEVKVAAVEMAAFADARIIERIHATQARNRPNTGEIDTHIVSEPEGFGLVKVALIDELNKIVNERSYGTGEQKPFWPAQEFGTGAESDGKVPSQEGRILFGTFEPSGAPPDGSQAGLGQGTDLAFIPHGSSPGFGRIGVELPARHFLTDGATEAGAEYVLRMNAIRDKYQTRFRALMAAFKKGQTGGRRITARIVT